MDNVEQAIVRIARSSDLCSISRIYARSMRELGKESFEWLRAVLRTRSKRIVTLVCELNGEVTGFTIAYKKRNAAYIESIAVDESARGKGIGSMLLSELEKTLAKKGVEKVYLSVKSWNIAALNFYLGKGYGLKGVVFIMTGDPDYMTTRYIPGYTVMEIAASRLKKYRIRPTTWWSNLVEDIDLSIYKKFYKEERAIIVKKDNRVKAVTTYSVNDELVVDNISLSSYNAIEALEATIMALRNIAVASGSRLIEIPVDASKRQLVKLIKEYGFKVRDSEYLLMKDLSTNH
ncbi:MAG: GNAT family N-acetyltransferase [Desulfurococcaceae archaeon]